MASFLSQGFDDHSSPKRQLFEVTDSLPWILFGATVVVLAILVCCFLILFYRLKNEVRTMRGDLTTARDVKVTETSVQNDRADRIKLEDPPEEWNMPTSPESATITKPVMPVVETVMMLPLRVTIIGCTGLATHQPAVCVCEVKGKASSRIQTGAVSLTPAQGQRQHIWNREAEVTGFSLGDRLSFSVWSQAGSMLSEVSLDSSAFHPAPFEGDLQLVQQVNADSGAAMESWTCPRCTCDNAASISSCIACGSQRPPNSAEPVMGKPATLSVRVTKAVWGPNATPLFAARWTVLNTQSSEFVSGEGAMRNDWGGDVGFRFVPRTSLLITALGRQAVFGQLREASIVTLWAVENQAATATATVGPSSTVEGGYAFAPLRQEVLLQAGREYRLSQQCTAGMADPWFDGTVAHEQLAQWSASACVDFLGAVFAEGYGYPSRVDFDTRFPTPSRRAGMLNFKMLGEDPVASAQEYLNQDSLQGSMPPGSDLALTSPEEAGDLFQIRLVCMSPPPPKQQ